jgi:hypothetical protein
MRALVVERRVGEGNLQTTTRFVCRGGGQEWHFADGDDGNQSYGGGGGGAGSIRKKYSRDDGDGGGRGGGRIATAALLDRLVHFFLPAGYPASVSEGYLRFAALGVGAGVASSAAFVLSTQSLLFAVGLGAGSIPMVREWVYNSAAHTAA